MTTGSGTAPATASATEVTISGNAGIGDVTITYTGTGGGASGSVQDDGAGNFSFKVAKGWSGSITPSKGTWIFSPASYSYNNLQVDQTSQNFTVAEPTPPQRRSTCDNLHFIFGTCGRHNVPPASFLLIAHLSHGARGMHAGRLPWHVLDALRACVPILQKRKRRHHMKIDRSRPSGSKFACARCAVPRHARL